jgi:hypothetical protein
MQKSLALHVTPCLQERFLRQAGAASLDSLSMGWTNFARSMDYP